MRKPVTAELLREALSLDAETGLLTWRERPRHHFDSDRDQAWWNGRFAGTPALRTVDKDGYLEGSVNGSKMRAHRAVFAITHGRMPVGLVDHADVDPANNRPGNLRDATHAQNQQNKRNCRNATGFKGVQRMGERFTDGKRFQARLMVAGKAAFLGLFPTAEEAHQAYVQGAKRHFGEFARAE